MPHQLISDFNTTCANTFLGKRDCLGKTLANTQLYLFLTGLLQRYQFTSVEKRLEDIDISPIIGFTTVAPHFKLIVTER